MVTDAAPTPVPVPAPAPAAPQGALHPRETAAYPLGAESAFSANLRHALLVLRRHAWMALAIVVACAALALVSTMLQTPRYTATTSVQINDQSEEVLGKEFEGSTLSPTSDWDTDRFLNTQLDILRSRGLAERVVDALDLGRSERFFAAMEAKPAGTPSDRREAAVALVRGALGVDLPRENRIARISFTSTDAAMSTRIADVYAAEFIQANLQRRFDASAYARSFVSDQLDEARRDLEKSEQDLNDYAKSVGLIRTRDTFNPSTRDVEAGTVTSATLMQTNEAANRARADRIAAEANWNAVRSAPLLSSPPVLANITVQTLMTKRAELESQLGTARQRYLPDHPAIGRIADELAATNAQLTRTATQVRDSARAQYVAAAEAERALTAQVTQARGQTLAEQDQSVRYNTLSREADTARSIYDGLLQRYRELNAAAGVAASNIAIIDKAEFPRAPSSPNLPRNLALGLLVGLVLAGLAVFLRDQLDDMIHTPEDVEDKLGLSLLGVVPRSQGDDPLLDLGVPKSPVAEAYYSLRGSLLYSTTQGLPRVMVVTSAQANEGKTTTAFAIADALARIGLRPVLIDADLRRPSLHRLTGAAGAKGLTDLLVSQDDPLSAVQRDAAHGFDVLVAGPLPPSPSELLSSARMAQVLETLAQHYDAVIVDSPPVLGLADAPMLAAIADGTIFVVEAERGRSGALKAALRRLRAVEPVLLGAVLAKFDPARAANRYSAYYGYNYYQYASGSAAGEAA